MSHFFHLEKEKYNFLRPFPKVTPVKNQGGNPRFISYKSGVRVILICAHPCERGRWPQGLFMSGRAILLNFPLRDFLLSSLPSPNQIHLLLSGRNRVSSVTLDRVFIDQQPVYEASIYCFNESVWMTSRKGFQVISWTGTIQTRQIKTRFLVCQMWF